MFTIMNKSITQKRWFPSVLLSMIFSIPSGVLMAADFKQNPFSLVYEGAITKNVKGKVNIHSVTYKLNGIMISANVYPCGLQSWQKISGSGGGSP